MKRRALTLVVLAGVLSALAAAPPALAKPRSAAAAVIADCNAHGRMTSTYSNAALRSALATMPATVKEYTDCYDVIQRQLLAQIGGAHGAVGSSSSGSVFPTWLIVVLVVLVLGAVGFAAAAIRRRGDGPPRGPNEP